MQVSSDLVADAGRARGEMKIVVKVDEGALVKVGRLEIRGAQAVSEAEIRRLINTQAGQPFSEATVAEDRQLVLNDYFNRGFAQVQLESSAKYSDDAQTRMDVVYEIHEGEQEFVNRVLLSGVAHTKPHIVQRASGDPRGGAAEPGEDAADAAQPVRPGNLQRGADGD